MILVELVPRDLEIVTADAKNILKYYPQVSGINVPDVLRLHNRSWQVADAFLQKNILIVPHIRSIDHDLKVTVNQISDLVKKGLKHVLIITGDHPQSVSVETHPITPMMVVEELKNKHPDLKVYCGLDPYRQSFREEISYCRQKIKAGADGFFSQPFFDPELARIYIEQLEAVDLFVGISPVTTEGSFNYWITRNNAIFPKNFGLSLEENCEVGRNIMAMANHHGKSSYLMPIKVDPFEYLKGLFV